MVTAYDRDFYAVQQEGSYRSARKVLRLLATFGRPRSAIDFGCGVGTWLAALEVELGVTDFVGLDGEYVDLAALKIPPEKFRPHDLERPYVASRRFDLAISLEVAEHLPPEAGTVLVQSLAAASDLVLFSAAVPFQGGVRHVNEQFPEYWAEKFASSEFVAIDALRDLLWEDEEVAWWYRQNILLFARRSVLPTLSPALQSAASQTRHDRLTRLHPGQNHRLGAELELRSTWRGFLGFKFYQFWKSVRSSFGR